MTAQRFAVGFLLAVLAAAVFAGCCARRSDSLLPGDDHTEASLQEMIGQMVMVGFRGTDLAESPRTRKNITTRHIGGVILFDYDAPSRSRPRNIVSPDQLARLCEALQALTPRPLLIAIDQEGGRVARLKPAYGFRATLSAEEMAAGGTGLVRECAGSMARDLSELGINVNLAPVVDVNVNPACPVIGMYGRSFSPQAGTVATFAAAYIRAQEAYSVLNTLKHFPGHGSSRDDSHHGFVDITETWSDTELLPYRRLINGGFDGLIMTAHVFNANLDPDHPATLSRPTITGILREQLGWDGVVISDDMQMRAITDNYSREEAITLALNAGVDILLFANNAAQYEPSIAAEVTGIVTDLVATGRVDRALIEASYRRIRRLTGRLRRGDGAGER